MLFFFMFSSTELPLCASRQFFVIFLINTHLEEDVQKRKFTRREVLKKLHRFLTFLDFKVGVYFNLRFQMQETDELNVTPPLSPSYKGRPAVYTGCVLCQISFTGCLKKNLKREKLEKYLILNISQKHYYAGKTVKGACTC